MELRPRQRAGFTLVEMVLVIVVLSILALGTTRYIVNSSQSFVVSAERAKLIATARVAVEQVVRRLRNALPNSVRISASGRCLEYFRVAAGSSTTAPLLSTVTSLPASPFDLNSGGTHFAVVAPFSPGELYQSTLPSPGVIAATTLNAAGNYTAIPLTRAGGHSFLRTSPTERVYLVTNPERFCVTGGGDLEHYTGYGINNGSPISNGAPAGANTSLMAEDLVLAGSPFIYSPGSLARNGLVQINLAFSKAGESVTMNHEVQIRNVP